MGCFLFCCACALARQAQQPAEPSASSRLVDALRATAGGGKDRRTEGVREAVVDGLAEQGVLSVASQVLKLKVVHVRGLSVQDGSSMHPVARENISLRPGLGPGHM